VTEKPAALVEIGVDTTRMKDVYDLHVILGREVFAAAVLGQALRRSFAARGTPTLRVPAILSDTFAQDQLLVARWKQYKRRTGAQAPTFGDVMAEVRAFFEPVLLQQQHGAEWNPHIQKWSEGAGETEATS
jgi:Nucleotidyl transferase AbiEii toxin, Type IV TA system